ncbi:4-hydroxythreonine-4-phosphate dehydrogenase PdxA [Rhodobacteraceae bacterium 63075]|nr:4-hydroxythreonine-4-phosphate dehydrogenase PdxA [Rhodobacteraceae bacterium 63075]
MPRAISSSFAPRPGSLNTEAIALTCGEPAGIGPDLAPMLWEALKGELCFFLLADPAHLPEGTAFERIAAPAEAAAVMPRALPVLAHDFTAPRRAGQPDPAHAQPVIEVIERAVQLTQTGEAAALCTLPIHKKALKDGAGFAFPGHTEFLAHLAGVRDVVMMLASPDLRVVPATIHIALSEVPRALTPEGLRRCIEITHAGLKEHFGLARPRLAIAGLNPHAGEGGAMGREELDWIAPLLGEMRAEGFDLRGPLPADTMFHAAAREGYDAAIAMYHDQALIPIKTLDFDRGVNVTLGLPFVRTSPDHGTAFDIAGTGAANPSSSIEALRLARAMSARAS